MTGLDEFALGLLVGLVLGAAVAVAAVFAALRQLRRERGDGQTGARARPQARVVSGAPFPPHCFLRATADGRYVPALPGEAPCAVAVERAERAGQRVKVRGIDTHRTEGWHDA